MESRHSSPDLYNAVPHEEQQTFPRLTQTSLSQIEDQSVDARSGGISFSRTTTEVADDDVLSQLEGQRVDALAEGITLSRTATEIGDDDAVSLYSTDASAETSEAQQDAQQFGLVEDTADVPSANQSAIDTGERANKLLQSVTKWNDDLRDLIESEMDYQGLKRSLCSINDDMTLVIARSNDEHAELIVANKNLIATNTKLEQENTSLALQLQLLTPAGPPGREATAPVELKDETKEENPSPQYLEDSQCRALTLCAEGSPEPNDEPMPSATRSAGWSSQQLPKTRIPPPLTLQNLPVSHQRSVGGDWTGAASGSKPSQLPSSGEISPDTPTRGRGDAKVINIWPALGTKIRHSIASISRRLSTDMFATTPAKRRGQKVRPTEAASHRTSEILGGLHGDLSSDDLASSNALIHNSEEYECLDREESEEGGVEETSNQRSMSRFSSRPLSYNVKRMSRFSTWMLDLPIQTLLSMARLGREGQSLDQELDAVGLEETSDWDPASQRSSRYINLKWRQPADRSSYVLCDTTQELHTSVMDDSEFGPNKSSGGPLMPVLIIAYLGLVVVTIQIYVASSRQQEIWLNANGLTRNYMLKTCLETPAWMLVPGVDGELVLGADEAETALSWLWQLLSWNSSVRSIDRWAYQIDGA